MKKTADIYIDGKYFGKAKNVELTIKEEEHVVVRSASGAKITSYPTKFSHEVMIDMEEKIDYNKKEEKEETNMKTLFNIIAVYNEEVVFEKKQVGADANNAVFKSGLYGKLNEMGVEDLDDVSILTTSLGFVKAGKGNDLKKKESKCSGSCNECSGCK